jgi:hypothetical protein
MKKLITKNKIMNSVEQAKGILKNNGYYVENLPRIQEVQTKFDCSDEQAYNILRNVFNQPHLTETINDLIDIEVEFLLSNLS